MSGDFEMINLKTGKRLLIQRDGTELRDEVEPPAIEYCDKGEHFMPKFGGKYDGADGLNMLWVCSQCLSG